MAAFANNLRGLADALTAFNNCRPGAFIDEDVVGEVAEQRPQRDQRRRTALRDPITDACDCPSGRCGLVAQEVSMGVDRARKHRDQHPTIVTNRGHPGNG